MSHDGGKPRKGYSGFQHTPGAMELRAIEKRIAVLGDERKGLERHSGMSRRLKELDAELNRLEWDRQAILEHVNASATQRVIYEKDRRMAEEAEALKDREVLERDVQRSTRAKATAPTAQELREFMKAWRKLGQTQKENHASKLLERDFEDEPE